DALPISQRFSRLHPRCGTSFLLIVMIVAIFVFAPIGLPAWWILLLTRILGVPLIAGLSFEIIKFAGRNRRRGWVRAVMWPGMKLQLLTTREPDLSQLAVAIAALDPFDERAVDLDHVDGQAPQLAQRREARAEVVDRDAHAGRAEGLELRADALAARGLVDQAGLGDLDAEAARGEGVLGDHLLD